jgi:polar amino acid transport system permease protein
MDYIFQFGVVWRNWDLFMHGVWLTIRICLISTTIGLAIGTVMAGLQQTKKTIFVAPIRAYIEVIRNTPFLIQLFFIFFGLPSIGIRLDATQAAIIALSVNTGAYATEIVRAGIESIKHGQLDAGNALGLNYLQIFRYIILPQAMKNVYPALTSQFILIMLGSSMISVIAAEELTYVAGYLQARTFRSFEIYLVVTLLYLGLSYFFRAIFGTISYFAFPKITVR